MKKTAYVKVFLDDNVPEYMNGVIRCGSVVSEDENGNELSDHQNLIDNMEFTSQADLIAHVANALNVPLEIVEIQD